MTQLELTKKVIELYSESTAPEYFFLQNDEGSIIEGCCLQEEIMVYSLDVSLALNTAKCAIEDTALWLVQNENEESEELDLLFNHPEHSVETLINAIGLKEGF